MSASSSSTYGDHPDLPKTEDRIGKPLSPYAVTKYVNELYATVFTQTYGVKAVGLRYFNIFGPCQDPNGPYAAVIPKWTAAMFHGETVYINGDGDTSRDFCYIAVGERTTLNELYRMIRTELKARVPGLGIAKPEDREFRAGGVDRPTLATSTVRWRRAGAVDYVTPSRAASS